MSVGWVPITVAVLSKALWVTSPNIPEAAGRYEVDNEYPPVHGHLTWVSTSFIGGIKTERRVALGSGCSGNVWLIGTTDAVEKDMGWIVTLGGDPGVLPHEVPDWGRAMNKDWVKDATVRVSAAAPIAPQRLFVHAPDFDHLRGECVLAAGARTNDYPVWECIDDPTSSMGRRYIFTDSHGNWVVGPDHKKDTGWAMASHHAGRLPHQITDWKRQDGAGGWVAEVQVRVLTSPADGGSFPVKAKASACSKFWIEGIPALKHTPFVAGDRLFNWKETYRSVDGAFAIYWCPSSFGLGGRSAWKVAAAAEFSVAESARVDKQYSYPNCPGFAICEDLTGEGFMAVAPTGTWHVWDQDLPAGPIWVTVDAMLTCYDDLL
ncbi:hypothetical protein DIPPA_10681 [Diplonema papillatum]|nr:hypothetical protein DIPPA_10681 [Diplonema papillatum]|eukprot:gene4450-6893_t